MSNETKIGILAVVAIALSLWGYKFILGQNMLLKSNIYKVEYSDVNLLKPGTNVVINGVIVGSVSDVKLLVDQKEKVLVTLTMESDIKIPKDTRAIILADGFMGGKVMKLEYERPCTGADCAKSGDYLIGESRGMISSMLTEDNLEGYVKVIKDGLKEVFDTLNTELLSEESNSPIANSIKDLQGTLSNLNSATNQLDGMLRRSSSKLDGTLGNLNDLTGSLSNRKGQIENIIANTDTLTSGLAAVDLEATIAEVTSTLDGLQETLSTTQSTIEGMNSLVGKLKAGEGSLGKMLNDDAFYDNLNGMSIRVDSLLSDIQERPYRYVPLKGRKRVKKYDRKDAADEGKTLSQN